MLSTEFSKILRIVIFEHDFEQLLLKLNSRLDNRRGKDFELCRFSHFYSEEPFMNHVKISFLLFIRFVLANSCVISSKIPWSIQSSTQQRLSVLINIFSRSHVSYCPFVWMWHGKILHNRIFRRHLQEQTFIISLFARWKQICFYSQ